MVTNEDIIKDVFGMEFDDFENMFADDIKKAMDKARQAGKEEQLAKDFIVDELPKPKDCCVVCGKKPDIIIHADCAFEKGVISKRMGEKNDEIARLREALEIIYTPNSIPDIYDCDSWADEVTKIAEKALEVKK